MPAPDMRKHVRGLIGQTVWTVVRGRPNTIVAVTPNQALVETETGNQNYVLLGELQELADRIYEGEEVTVPARGRSAFHAAVLAALPEVEFAVNPRRFWLRGSGARFDSAYSDLFPEGDPVTASEGRVSYRRHLFRERSPVLRRLKMARVRATGARLLCEVCGFDFAETYGALGEGFIECHHVIPLAAAEERETSVDDLALVCANCHRMIHLSTPMLSIEELRGRLQI